LYAGKSIYSFCISPELTLEHLHWGEAVPAGYDLRYLCQSSRLTHFTTVEAAPDKFTGKIVIAADTLEEVQKTWRENKVWGLTEMSDLERFQKRRLENYSWRLMSKILDDGHREKSLKRLTAKERKEPNLLSCKAHDLDQNYGFTDLPGIEEDSPHPLPTNLTKKKFHYIPSEANLLNLREKHEKSHIGNIPKPRIIELLQCKKQHSNRKSMYTQTFERALGKIGKGGICVEYSDFGTGDFRSPSFQVIDNFNGSSIAPLRYRKHRIYKGKLPIPDHLPEVRCYSENEASTLVVTLSDIISGLDVDLIYGKFICDYDKVFVKLYIFSLYARLRCNNSSCCLSQR
jgi:hypothetical protein